MTWIETIPYADSAGPLRRLYDRTKGPDDNVDNIMLAHGLRPHTLEGHMALYKRVLHHSGNAIERGFLETLGVYTSLLNRCDYCVEHHAAGLARLVDPEEARRIRSALESGDLEAFDERQRRALRYAQLLTEQPARLAATDLEALREVGWSDGEILEINQVVAYFAYANRTVLGLGVSTDGDVLGLSPAGTADPDDWSHR